jgi:hypothetical protein
MSSPNAERTTELPELLARAQPNTNYDVEAGARRHRQLLTQGAPTPDWAPVVLRTRRLPSPWMWSVIGGALLVGIWAWQSAPSAPSHIVTYVEPSAPVVLTAPSARPTIEPLIVAPASPVAPQSAVHRPAVAASARQIAEPTPSPAVIAIKTARRAQGPAVADERVARAARAPRSQVVSAPGAVSATVDAPLLLDLSVSSPAPAPASVQDTTPDAPARMPAPEAIDPEVLEEMQQLATAERLLPTMPSRTLTLVREGMQRFSRGYLAQERRYLEIMALLALKMPKDAELLSRGFLRDYPKGPYRRKVERALVEGTRY